MLCGEQDPSCVERVTRKHVQHADKDAVPARNMILRNDPISNMNKEKTPQERARFRQQFLKTRQCRFHQQGHCWNGEACKFAHGDVEVRYMPNLSKTSVCKMWLQGLCSLSSHDCQFAHGSEELRATESFVKTSLCRMFFRGHCPRGDQCRHAHSNQELQVGQQAEREQRLEEYAESGGFGLPAEQANQVRRIVFDGERPPFQRAPRGRAGKQPGGFVANGARVADLSDLAAHQTSLQSSQGSGLLADLSGARSQAPGGADPAAAYAMLSTLLAMEPQGQQPSQAPGTQLPHDASGPASHGRLTAGALVGLPEHAQNSSGVAVANGNEIDLRHQVYQLRAIHEQLQWEKGVAAMAAAAAFASAKGALEVPPPSRQTPELQQRPLSPDSQDGVVGNNDGELPVDHEMYRLRATLEQMEWEKAGAQSTRPTGPAPWAESGGGKPSRGTRKGGGRHAEPRPLPAAQQQAMVAGSWSGSPPRAVAGTGFGECADIDTGQDFSPVMQGVDMGYEIPSDNGNRQPEPLLPGQRQQGVAVSSYLAASNLSLPVDARPDEVVRCLLAAEPDHYDD